jgi:uncharacterized membrane protein
MNFAPILQAPLAVKIHLATILPAFVLGTWLIFLSIKGSRPHRAAGAVYMGLMLISATAAIFIQEVRPGRFSWLHLFVLLTYWGVARALWAVRQKDIPAHKGAMYGLYIGGLVIAGALTFAPGRIMYRLFFN